MSIVDGRTHYLETEFEVYRRIRSSLDSRSPISVVRLGDGEGALLGYPEIRTRQDVDRFLRIWLRDDSMADDLVVGLVAELRTAVAAADVVGLPRRRQEEAHPNWAVVRQAVQLHGLLNSTVGVTNSCLHRLLAHALLFRPLLSGRDYLGTVSCRDVRGRLSSCFGIGECEWYGVRGERDRPGIVETPHWPDGFEAMREKLRVPHRGALFLVGAGPFGKIYCHWIKERGGVAVDVGSLFDAWAGIGRIGAGQPLKSLDVYERLPRIRRRHAVRRTGSAWTCPARGAARGAGIATLVVRVIAACASRRLRGRQNAPAGGGAVGHDPYSESEQDRVFFTLPGAGTSGGVRPATFPPPHRVRSAGVAGAQGHRLGEVDLLDELPGHLVFESQGQQPDPLVEQVSDARQAHSGEGAHRRLLVLRVRAGTYHVPREFAMLNGTINDPWEGNDMKKLLHIVAVAAIVSACGFAGTARATPAFGVAAVPIALPGALAGCVASGPAVLICGGVVVTSVLCYMYCSDVLDWVMNMAGHRAKRPSTEDKHEKGDSRRKRDQERAAKRGGTKGGKGAPKKRS